jgi:hypothetical protein
LPNLAGRGKKPAIRQQSIVGERALERRGHAAPNPASDDSPVDRAVRVAQRVDEVTQPDLRINRHAAHAIEAQDGELVLLDADEPPVRSHIRAPLLRCSLLAEPASAIVSSRLRTPAIRHSEVDQLQLTPSKDLHEAKVTLAATVLLIRLLVC